MGLEKHRSPEANSFIIDYLVASASMTKGRRQQLLRRFAKQVGGSTWMGTTLSPRVQSLDLAVAGEIMCSPWSDI
jgi:hypothetical protein